MSESPGDRTNPVELPRRGPYGPVRAFVSKGQPLVWVESGESLLSAMDRLSGEGFWRVPVRKNGRCTASGF
jgi:predicted oxidoreductase